MRLSRFFLPILREAPREAEIVSHRLMLRAGMMRQEAAGIYAFLPLGWRVLQKVVQIVTPTRDARLIDAAETVLAEAYVRLARSRKSSTKTD